MADSFLVPGHPRRKPVCAEATPPLRAPSTDPSGRARSVAVETSDPVAMEGRIAELELRGPRALQEEAHVVLVGHPDAPVHLYALVADHHEGVGAPRLRHACQPCHTGVVGVLVQRAVRGENDGACELDLDELARRTVLERLEAADRHAELRPG